MIWTWKFFKADIIVKLFKLKYINNWTVDRFE